MKKKISVVLLIVLIFSMMTMLMACNYETKFATKLQKSGYSFVARDELFYDSAYEGGFYRVTAVNDNSGYVTILFFKKKEDATKAYNTFLLSKEDDEQVIQKGKKVFIGNKQGIKDLGL